MSYLVDSDWVADWLKGRSDAVQLLTNLAQRGPLAISLITYGEIYEGIYSGYDPKGYEAVFRQFLRSVDVLALNRATMRRFARIRGDLRRQGRMLPDPDLLIAATAIEHGLTLVTRNVRHFARVPGLVLHEP
jgi:predicted nucleic acid-binding protein